MLNNSLLPGTEEGLLICTRPHLHLADKFLNQKTVTVVIEGDKSDNTTELSGVPQGTFVGPLLFHLAYSVLGLYIYFCVCVFLVEYENIMGR